MLYDIHIGSKKPAAKWALESKAFGDMSVSYLTNLNSHVQIKIGRNVKAMIDEVSCEEIDGGSLTSYEIPKSTFLSHNNKTMNLVLMNFWDKDKEVVKSHLDDDIFDIHVDTSKYKLIAIDPYDGDIIHTYKRKNLIGGVLRVKNGRYSSETVFEIILFDMEIKKYVVFMLSKDATRTNHLLRYNCLKEDVGDIKTRFPLQTKSNFNAFKCTCYDTGILTTLVVVNKTDAEALDAASFVTSKREYLNIITIDDDLEDKESESRKVITDYISKNNIKAVTTVNDVKIPADICKQLKILYIFNYNLTDEHIRCIKSN